MHRLTELCKKSVKCAQNIRTVHRAIAMRLRGDLIVDDAPGVWHNGIVLPGKRMVANSRSSKGIAGYIQRV